ncbi:MAG TPA: aspartate aminotransferase family protein [Actinomycetota bacterium]|jgi:glutamate-1-semialdehyde 2,1-aminomutase|nr:aspartate aminotransferase family protein [Actinomycetota bacterium]
MGRRPDQERIDSLTQARTQLVHERTPKSREWRERSLASLPLGVASSFQDSPPYPIFFERAKGSRVWDVDGNEYADYHNGFGVMAVGHAHPKIVEALSERAAIGTHFAQPVAETTLLAEELCSRFKIDQMRFTNSGTEATMDAIRLARGVTGRDRIVKIEGSYHGHHESVLVSIRPSRDKMGPREAPASVEFGSGTPKAVTDLTLIVPYNDAEDLDRLLTANAGEVAAMIMEPVMMNVGIIDPEPGYLDAVREICSRHGVILIFDEVKTGATIAYGGAEEVYGVAPDLKCFAKAVGGGTPLGGFGGRGELMAEIAKDGVPQLGTFNGNPLCARAGLVALTEVLTEDAYKELNRLNDAQLAGCQRVIDTYDLPCYTTGVGGKGAVMYAPERLRDYRAYAGFDGDGVDEDLSYLSWLYEMTEGVFMTPGIDEQWTLSVQHTDEDVARYVNAFETFAREVTGR